MSTKIWAVVKLLLTVGVVAGLAYVAKLVIDGINQATESAKTQLSGKGVNITSSGVAVKTDRRAMTQEETQDKLQKGLMKGWKNSTFEVPWLLQKGTNLGGSSHDKSKAEWEAKHGHKPAKKVE